MQIPSALQSALQGLQRYDWQMAQAASQVARFGDSLDPSRNAPAPGVAPAGAPDGGIPHSIDVVTEDLSGAMLKMLLAQRAYTAQIRIISVTDEMQQQVTDLGARKAA